MATVAVIGAGSLQGRELLTELEGRSSVERVVLFSEKAAGTEVPFRGRDLVVEGLDEDSTDEKVDAVFFTNGAARALRWAGRFAEAGSRVIDLSAAHRLDPKVPLIGLSSAAGSKLLSVPGAAALAAGRLLAPLYAPGSAAGRAGLASPRLTATLLVPVSAAGQPGVLELSRQTADLLAGRPAKPRRFPHRIAFNLTPEVGDGSDETGETSQEHSFAAEVRRLWALPSLAVAVTAARVPIFFGLSLALSGSTGDSDSATALRESIAGQSRGVKNLDGSGTFPMPSLTVGDGHILVGRIRSDGAGGFQAFACVDPLKLVAEAAVQAGLGGER